MKDKISIHIGEFYAGTRPTAIFTLVGSCVAVCLLDTVTRIGGMNHILMPGKAKLKDFSASSRYGVNLMELLINDIMKRGGNRNRMVAKVFGGAHILSSISIENGVGRKSATFVIGFLQSEGIRIISQDLGGHAARKIYCHRDTGDVFLKRLNSTQLSNLAVEEQEQLKRIRNTYKRPGKVTLFSVDDSKNLSC